MHASTRRLALALTLLPLAFAGCSGIPAVDPAQHFRLTAAEPVAAAVLVVDDRTAEQRAARTYPDGTLVSEANLAPDVASYVAQEMTRAIQASPDRARLEALLAGKTIHLRHVEIVAMRANPRYSRNLSNTPPGVAAMDAMAGLLGSALNVHARFYVDIDVDLGADHYISHATGTMNVVPFPDALIVPAHDAVTELLGHIADGHATGAATPS